MVRKKTGGRGRRELLPRGASPRTWPPDGLHLAGGHSGLDYPASRVGTAGRVTVYCATSLGDRGATFAARVMNAVTGPYAEMELVFGVSGRPVSVIIAELSGKNDGSGGAYHHGCDFQTGADLYLDATFAAATVDPIELETGLYVAELSEAFMGLQGRGWGCGFSNGEALSRLCAEESTAPGTMRAFSTAPSWARAGRPDWISRTNQTDTDDVSTGCGVVYLHWMRSLGRSSAQIAQAGGETLAENYRTITGRDTAYTDLLDALLGVAITSDNPFGMTVRRAF